jgi:hypothetical protein
MKRAFLVAIAGFAAAACYTSPAPPIGDLVVYWDFQRNVISPQALPLPYTCAGGGVDYVVVTDGNGYLLDPASPTLACTQRDIYGDPVQGITFIAQPAGTWTVRVRGYRSVPGGDVAIFDGTQTANVVPAATSQATVLAWGVQRDVDLNAYLYQVTGTPGYYTSCNNLAGNITTITYSIQDGVGTTVDAANNISCINPLPVLFFTGLLDLDNYTVVADGYTATPTRVFGSCSVAFDHFGTDTGLPPPSGFGIRVDLDNPPCL